MKIERTVLIQKDQNGFGLRVAGERPVYVESVKFGRYRSEFLTRKFEKYSLTLNILTPDAIEQ